LPRCERSNEVTGGANGGRRRVAREREEKEAGGFIATGRVEAVATHLRGLQELKHGCGGGGDVRRTGGQWRMAVRPPASARRPRGTGLGFACASWALAAQCRRRGPRTAGFSGASVCARRPGTASRRGGRAGDVVRGCARVQTQFDLTIFDSTFLQFSKPKCINR
jgi:hypothetical protein